MLTYSCLFGLCKWHIPLGPTCKVVPHSYLAHPHQFSICWTLPSPRRQKFLQFARVHRKYISRAIQKEYMKCNDDPKLQWGVVSLTLKIQDYHKTNQYVRCNDDLNDTQILIYLTCYHIYVLECKIFSSWCIKLSTVTHLKNWKASILSPTWIVTLTTVCKPLVRLIHDFDKCYRPPFL